jgi:P27 family predicted phage terminase small subunit
MAGIRAAGRSRRRSVSPGSRRSRRISSRERLSPSGRRVVPELARLKLLKPVDSAALTAYCLAWQRLVDAQAIIAREGLLGHNSQGQVRHPAVAVLEAASKDLRAWAAEFGLTPSAETRVTRPEAGDGDEANPFA